jgi:stage V sporulation protein T
MYSEMIDECANRIDGLQNQIALIAKRQSTIVHVNRIAKTAMDIFDDILQKDNLSECDVDLIIDRIVVFEDRIDVKLKSDIDSLLKFGEITLSTEITQLSPNKKSKAFDVHVVSNGDPLEIYTSSDGEVIFKKYSAISEMADNALQVADIMNKLANCPVIVFDRDHVVAVAGVQKKEFIERRASAQMEDLMENRKQFVLADGERKLVPVEGIERGAVACSPIVSSGDVIGAVAFMESDSSHTSATELQRSLIQASSQFLGKQNES